MVDLLAYFFNGFFQFLFTPQRESQQLIEADKVIHVSVGHHDALDSQQLAVGDRAEIAGVRPPGLTTPMWLARAGAPFVTMAGRIMGREPLYTAEALRALRDFLPVSHAKAGRELDYKPRPLRETVGDFYGWLRDAGGPTDEREVHPRATFV